MNVPDPITRATAAGLLFVLIGCAHPAPTAPPQAPSPPPAAPLQQAAPQTPAEKFAAFISEFRVRALERGITAATYDSATAGLRPLPEIAPLYQEQPEFTKPVWEYIDSAAGPQRVGQAKALLASNATMLAAIENSYGVPAEILVAIWGMESDYGRDTGGFNLFGALTTLAYDSPLQDFARPEFLAALRIMQTENYPPSEMTGSWAGAFGQTQFTPTIFLRFAIDGDGDGKIDLWHSPADALASSAHMLASSGWVRGRPWGMEVTLPADFPYADADPDAIEPVSQWSALGVTAADGSALGLPDEEGAIYLPAGARGPAFLLLDNFRVLLKYNNAASYALAVGLLADRARGRGTILKAWPRDETPLSRAERLQFQADLKALGFDPGDSDGVLGRKTRAALRLYQVAHGRDPDGFATRALLLQMNAEIAVPAEGNG